jgi:hypothetical protein
LFYINKRRLKEGLKKKSSSEQRLALLLRRRDWGGLNEVFALGYYAGLVTPVVSDGREARVVSLGGLGR